MLDAYWNFIEQADKEDKMQTQDSYKEPKKIKSFTLENLVSIKSNDEAVKKIANL
jgi:hypothetical protein